MKLGRSCSQCEGLGHGEDTESVWDHVMVTGTFTYGSGQSVLRVGCWVLASQKAMECLGKPSRDSARSGDWQGAGASPYLTPAEKLTTGKNSPSRLKASKTPCTGQPLMRKEMDGTLRSRQQLTTSSGARRCCPG